MRRMCRCRRRTGVGSVLCRREASTTAAAESTLGPTDARRATRRITNRCSRSTALRARGSGGLARARHAGAAALRSVDERQRPPRCRAGRWSWQRVWLGLRRMVRSASNRQKTIAAHCGAPSWSRKILVLMEVVRRKLLTGDPGVLTLTLSGACAGAGKGRPKTPCGEAQVSALRLKGQRAARFGAESAGHPTRTHSDWQSKKEKAWGRVGCESKLRPDRLSICELGGRFCDSPLRTSPRVSPERRRRARPQSPPGIERWDTVSNPNTLRRESGSPLSPTISRATTTAHGIVPARVDSGCGWTSVPAAC